MDSKSRIKDCASSKNLNHVVNKVFFIILLSVESQTLLLWSLGLCPQAGCAVFRLTVDAPRCPLKPIGPQAGVMSLTSPKSLCVCAHMHIDSCGDSSVRVDVIKFM